MMFHDPMAVAQDKMTQVCLFLEHHHLPPTPLNYQVAYTYVSKTITALNQAIDRAALQNDTIDSIIIEHLYFEHLHPSHSQETAMLKQVDTVIASLSSQAQHSERSVSQFAAQLSVCVHQLDEHNVAKTKRALAELNKHTQALLLQHRQFKQELAKARQLQQKNLQQLNELRRQHMLDPQSGLYKRHYLNQQTQLWLGQDKQLCAIAIQVDNLDEFCQDYGDVVGEVVLNKVAKQIHKYVKDSGLPGRTSKNQFTVLLADIEPETANIIAEKVRNGVEKLKFISSKNNLNLPPVKITLGIAKHQAEQDFNALARHAACAAHKAQALGQACYISGSTAL
ncbi:GGDEF domain-containing protein [Pseudoalteromonas fenneropenaei]|uniref:GGDEF domain-containing protein n=1 Tax=Pseudoalteromonas fenneropenaei TaxID=1737459 RepID=A0ABV7CNR5_9GAMM